MIIEKSKFQVPWDHKHFQGVLTDSITGSHRVTQAGTRKVKMRREAVYQDLFHNTESKLKMASGMLGSDWSPEAQYWPLIGC